MYLSSILKRILLQSSFLLLCVMMCFMLSARQNKAGYISLLSNWLSSLRTSSSGGTSRLAAVLMPASRNSCCCKCFSKISALEDPDLTLGSGFVQLFLRA